MDHPNFVYDKNYYFDVNTKTIYGKNKYSFGYRHELSHYNDYNKKWYRSINLLIQLLNQFTAMTFVFSAGYTLIFNPTGWGELLKILGMCFIPYCLWSFQEELRADIYAWRKRK